MKRVKPTYIGLHVEHRYFMRIRPVRAELLNVDRQTYRIYEDNSRFFSILRNAPKNDFSHNPQWKDTPPPGAEFKNEWRSISTPLTHLHGVYMDVTFLAAFVNCERTVGFVSSVRMPISQHACPSVRSHGTRLPLDGFSWNLIFENLKMSKKLKFR
jgi:hypothetical protein